jgi:DNA-binding CsgD family transcriptional regulator
LAPLDLSVTDVTEIRRLLTLDETGHPDRIRYCLVGLMRLVPCDVAGFAIGDRHGYVEHAVVVPEGHDQELGRCGSALLWPTGIEHHVARTAAGQQGVDARTSTGARDTLRIGFGVGGDRIAQFWLDRRSQLFEPRHVQILSMLEPALARVARRPPDSRVSAALSESERRVVQLVALGGTNREIACRLAVTEATVRKHLEHAYRKLGVTNRTAAAALVRVSETP